MILNIETSTDCCSAALTHEGEILEERIEKQNMNHARLIAPFADECMAYARARGLKPEAVAVSIGPGSYTGLRIGLSLAKGLSMGLDIPLIGIPTLQILAVKAMFRRFDWEGDELLVPMLDARRMEVYTAVYDFALNALEEPHPLILEADSFDTYLRQGRKLIFMGNGSDKYRELLPESRQVVYMSDIVPTAASMMALSEKAQREQRYIDIAYSVPEYLKEFQATVPRNKVLGSV